MAIAVTIAAVVLLTVVTLLVARAGGRKHQDTRADRPAGPGAEPMGVADAGDPSVDPAAERRR